VKKASSQPLSESGKKGRIMTKKVKKRKFVKKKDPVFKKIVVFFDICSSTRILEELLRTENQYLWRNLIKGLERHLIERQASVDFELYKFLGDGWVLLFEPGLRGLYIFEFLEDLADEFFRLYNRRIDKVLSIRIPVVGITFGMDMGSCIRPTMGDDRREYIGRPLNVAGRLQDAVGQKGQSPANKGLVSKNLMAEFIDEKQIKRKYTVYRVKRTLKNISEGEDFQCLKVELK
jgi:class 3 adenylate cyclase